MTAEVCMMNRLAVVLAADSATTVSRWHNGKREERYFKGANKIFQLSDMHPVGLMIFDSADILSVPWEVIVKEFRVELGKKSFNTVEEYATEFLTYLSDNARLFPDAVQVEQLRNAAVGVAIRWINDGIKGEDKPDQHQIDEHIEQEKVRLEAAPLSPCIGAETLTKAIADLSPAVWETIEELLNALRIPSPSDPKLVSALAIEQVMKFPQDYLETTGLVVAGFGDHQIFPAMAEYLSCGIVAGKHVYSRQSQAQLDHNQPAWLSGFAQTEMIDTFATGFGADLYGTIMVAINDNILAFGESVAAKSGGDFSTVDDLPGLVNATLNKIGSDVMDKAMKEHSLPLRSVLGFLPVDEMAELAETLINLQSLKEKVTKPSTTVGGPVDVAIITKHEGLVWIKRKHFFNADLNSRFSLRQAAKYS